MISNFNDVKILNKNKFPYSSIRIVYLHVTPSCDYLIIRREAVYFPNYASDSFDPSMSGSLWKVYKNGINSSNLQKKHDMTRENNYFILGCDCPFRRSSVLLDQIRSWYLGFFVLIFI